MTEFAELPALEEAAPLIVEANQLWFGGLEAAWHANAGTPFMGFAANGKPRWLIQSLPDGSVLAVDLPDVIGRFRRLLREASTPGRPPRL